MGTLFWQFNDVWPGVSWSAIDYYGVKKPLYYQAMKAFEPLSISVEGNADTCLVYVMSEKGLASPAILNIRVLDFLGRMYAHWQQEIVVPANGVNQVQVNVKQKVPELEERFSFMMVELFEGNTLAGEYFFYFKKPAELILEGADIQISKEAGTYRLESDVLCKNVWLSVDDEPVNFWPNHFDLLPGRYKLVWVESHVHVPPEKIRIQCLNNVKP